MSRLCRLLTPIPPALRPPLAAGLIVFLVAVVTTQVALYAAGRDADQQIRTLSRVYLAGIADAVAPTLESGNLDRFDARFAAAVASHEDIVERVLFAFRTDGTLVATAGEKSISAEEARSIKVEGFRVDEAQAIAWVSRRLSNGSDFVLVSGLDVSEIIEQRNRLKFSIIGIDLILASICGLFTYLTLKRMNRPLTDLVDRLSEASTGPVSAIPITDETANDPRIAAIYRSFNTMIESVKERERLRDELAEHEQSAALGRLAATIAHEVRNPLGGLATAVSTLKRFGSDAEVRAESLGFLERGIEALDKIVASTLNLYRPEDDRHLTRNDFADLERLIRPAADRGAIRLDWHTDLPGTLSVPAIGARQVLLNLLLNACAVTQPGGCVSFAARVEGDALVCEISDEGGGMSSGQAGHLSGRGGRGGRTKRIGIDVIVGLLETLDGRASVETDAERGSKVTISIPLEPLHA